MLSDVTCVTLLSAPTMGVHETGSTPRPDRPASVSMGFLKQAVWWVHRSGPALRSGGESRDTPVIRPVSGAERAKRGRRDDIVTDTDELATCLHDDMEVSV